MKKDNLDKELKVIGTYLISQIRRDMTSNGLKASGSLYNSLTKEVVDNSLSIKSNDYGSVVLGEGSAPTNKNPSREMVSRITSWMSYKQMQPMGRGRGGRFRKRTASTLKSSAWIISKRILERGVKGSNIIQKSVQRLESRIEKGIVKAYKADVTKQFEETIIRINAQQK